MDEPTIDIGMARSYNRNCSDNSILVGGNSYVRY
jgi:hypothetical protein